MQFWPTSLDPDKGKINAGYVLNKNDTTCMALLQSTTSPTAGDLPATNYKKRAQNYVSNIYENNKL